MPSKTRSLHEIQASHVLYFTESRTSHAIQDLAFGKSMTGHAVQDQISFAKSRTVPSRNPRHVMLPRRRSPSQNPGNAMPRHPRDRTCLGWILHCCGWRFALCGMFCECRGSRCVFCPAFRELWLVIFFFCGPFCQCCGW